MKKEFGILIFLGITCNLIAQEYETIQIGDQVWMAKNLDIDSSGSRCYKDLLQNCKDFGRLYNWEAAITICPQGFRLPTDEEWTILTGESGGSDIAGRNLLTRGKSGFKALPGGNYNDLLYVFSYLYINGYYWTSTSFNETTAWMRQFDVNKTNINRSTVKKHYYFSVRCIKE